MKGKTLQYAVCLHLPCLAICTMVCVPYTRHTTWPVRTISPPLPALLTYQRASALPLPLPPPLGCKGTQPGEQTPDMNRRKATTEELSQTTIVGLSKWCTLLCPSHTPPCVCVTLGGSFPSSMNNRSPGCSLCSSTVTSWWCRWGEGCGEVGVDEVGARWGNRQIHCMCMLGPLLYQHTLHFYLQFLCKQDVEMQQFGNKFG